MTKYEIKAHKNNLKAFRGRSGAVIVHVVREKWQFNFAPSFK